MATPERVVEMKEDVKEFLLTMEGALEEVQAESKMTRFDVELENPSESSRCDLLSIHYCPTNSAQRQSFLGLLTSELILRGLEISGNMEARQEQLQQNCEGNRQSIGSRKKLPMARFAREHISY